MEELKNLIQKADRTLVVAPHPDDETIGCGGLLTLYSGQTDVLVLTDGSKGNYKSLNLTTEQLINERKKELRKAMSFAKVTNIYYLNIEDKKIIHNKKAIRSFDFSRYNYIFVPNRYEIHIDHRFAFRYIRQQIDQYKINLAEYEVWSPIPNPNCFLDIGAVFDEKKQMIDVYKTQTVCNDYNKLASGLNEYRGALVHRMVAETYYLTKKKEHFNLIKRIINKIKRLVNHNE